MLIIYLEAHSVAIVNPPIALTADLVKLLAPTTDIKLKHGVIGLLKHLAQSTINRSILGESGVVTALAKSGIWAENADMAELVQVSAIGVVKHLCNNNGRSLLLSASLSNLPL
jgi:hypothetical protein